MLDEAIDDISGLRTQPVWTKMPQARRQALREALPEQPQGLAAAYDQFRETIRPYATGNRHPAFFGWVHGAGTVVGMLAEMLAASLNANLGGRDHAPIEVERQVIRWAAEMLGFPAAASGVLVTGTSMANMIGVLVARTQCLGPGVRRHGVGMSGLRAYSSAAAHNCISRAMDMTGLGTDALRLIACDEAGRMDLAALAEAVARDIDDGFKPFLVVGTAGTVDTGAIDDLSRLADFCAAHEIWFHVDGAFGALVRLSPTRRGLLDGIERADSVAFDFHKWAQVPYDAGCIVVRDPLIHRAAFASSADYLRRDVRGLAGGAPWPCDLGPDLSRGFRALKVWMTIKTYGTRRLGAVVDHSCDLAQYLARRVAVTAGLELLAPVALNIVCFRVIDVDGDLDTLNAEIVADLQEAGIAAPSTTKINGVVAIRAAIVNHRSTHADIDRLLEGVLAAARRHAGV
ncbi:MAG: aspartate aminotransferase family protein [Rhodospirillales bacterium]|nr:aspartate aminotransferase family protein [Rhodospirillales bacterium]